MLDVRWLTASMMPRSVEGMGAFLSYGFLMTGTDAGYPMFSFGVNVQIAKVCFKSRLELPVIGRYDTRSL